MMPSYLERTVHVRNYITTVEKFKRKTAKKNRAADVANFLTISTALFLYVGAEPIIEKIERIKQKYGLIRVFLKKSKLF